MADMKTFGSGEVSPEEVRNRQLTIALCMLIGIVSFPVVVIVSALMWFLVSAVRIAPKTIYASYGIFLALSLVTGFGWWGVKLITQFFQGFFEWLSADFSFGGLIGQLLSFYLHQTPLALMVGGLIGCVYTAFRMFFRDKWTEIEFRLTPIQMLQKKKNIKSIQYDENSPSSGRTLGVNRVGDKIIQKENEARAHTMVLGASGTGKALHVDTPIITTTGVKKMKDIVVGDIVFSHQMKRVEVAGAFDIEKNKPSYTFTFSNGEKITSDGEHLWTISTGETITTEEIVSRVKAGETISISVFERRPLLMDQVVETQDIDPFIAGSYLQLNSGISLRGGTQGSHLSAEWLNRGQRLVQDDSGIYGPEPKIIDKLSHISIEDYFNAPLRVREDFLAGIIRSGGFLVDPKGHDSVHQIFGYENNKNPEMVNIVKRFAVSLGENVVSTGNTVIFQATNHYAHNSHMDIRGAYPTLIDMLKLNQKSYILTGVEKTVADVRCIKVDSEDGLFLAGNMGIPTHNTTTLMLMARDVIKQGHGFLMVDVKGGPDVPDFIKQYADRYGRKMYHWSMHDAYLEYNGPADRPAYYDPITRGDPSRRKDLILSLRQWDTASDVYKNATAAYLQTLFNVIRLAPADKEIDTLTDVISLMQNSQVLLDRLETVPHNRRAEDFNRTRQAVLGMIQENNKVQKDAIKTTQQTLQIFSQSIAGPWLGKDPHGDENINLWDIANNGDIAIFSLDSSNYPELSQNIANLIIQDLKTASSEFRSKPPANTLDVFIDEFSAIESDNLVQLVNKCRDANIPVVFSTQTIADMKNVSDTFAEQLNGIISSFIIHRVNSDTEAKTYAGIFGSEDKAEIMQEVEHTSGFGKIGFGAATGKGRLTYKEDYIVPFKKFQEQSLGQMIYHSKAGNTKGTSGRIEHVQVIPEPGYIVKDDERKKVSESTKNRYDSIENASPSVTWRDAEPSEEEIVDDEISEIIDNTSYDFDNNEPLGQIQSKGEGLDKILNLSVLGQESSKAKSIISSRKKTVVEDPTLDEPEEIFESEIEEPEIFEEPKKKTVRETEEKIERPTRKKEAPKLPPKRPSRYASRTSSNIPEVRVNPETNNSDNTVRATKTPPRPQRPQVSRTRPSTHRPVETPIENSKGAENDSMGTENDSKSSEENWTHPRPIQKRRSNVSPRRPASTQQNIKQKTTKIQNNPDSAENKYSW